MPPVGDIPGGAPHRKDVIMRRKHHTLMNGGECGNPRNSGARKRLVNKNDTLPDTSLERVFAEFYKLKKGLEDHPGDETYTDHATIILVTIVENMLRVRMLPRTNALADDWKVTLRVPLLVDAAWGSDGGEGLAGRDHVKAVSDYLESIGKDGSAERVCLRAGDIDRFIDAVCPKPEPYLKNTILASSYTFQNVKSIKDEFEEVFVDTGHPESDYAEMFNARHALVHSLLREHRPEADGLALKRVHIVEALFRRLLQDTPGVFDLYKGVALVDIDPEEALAHLEAAAKQAGGNGWTSYHLGRAYRKTGDTENAKAELLKAAKNIGDLRKEMEGRLAHTDYAVREWMKFDTALLALCLGMEMERLGDDGAAAECFMCAVSINGESYPELYVWAAWQLEGISRFEDAIWCLDRALGCEDLTVEKRADAYNDKGVMLRLLGQEGRARTCFEKALELNPAHPRASKHLSELAVGLQGA